MIRLDAKHFCLGKLFSSFFPIGPSLQTIESDYSHSFPFAPHCPCHWYVSDSSKVENCLLLDEVMVGG